MADLNETSAIAAEGIKQLVETGRKTLQVTEQVAGLLGRIGSASPVAGAFAEAAIVSNRTRESPAARVFAEAAAELRASGTRSRPSPVQTAVDAGISQVQEAAQPKAERIGQRRPPTFAAVQAAMMRAIERGEDPVKAGRNPGGPPLAPNQWPRGMPGLPLRPNQWPSGMPGLPVGTPGNPAPGNMPTIPSAAPAAASSGLGGTIGSLLRIGGLAGAGAGILAQQFGGNFSAGHGMEQFLRESNRQADYQTSLLTRLRVGADVFGESITKTLIGGLSMNPFAAAHLFESGKTSVGNGPK